jgi:trehalose-6-phosphatase
MFADDLDDALFLDIDGALLEIAPTPDSVRVPRELIELLEMLTLLPFRGRRPIFIGGSLAQDAFEAVNVAGGLAIEVGTDGPTAATLRIANVASVHEVLEILLQELAHAHSSLH